MEPIHKKLRALTWVIAVAIMATMAMPAFAGETIREKEMKRIRLNKKYDKKKLRQKTDFVVDTSDKFLKLPKGEELPENAIIAKTAPTVKMRIFPGMDPEYFTDMDADGEAYMVAWANWARVTRSEDNRFYMSVSDHRGRGCNIFIYEYTPSTGILGKVVDVGEVVGWTKDTMTDGKIHGHMGIMPDGTLWAATHYGVFPDESWWANGYRGSWLISYNIYTRESKNWGNPLIGNMLPCFNVDTRRGRLVGTGANFTVLSWDCFNQKVRFAGYPPNGWKWWRRAMLCDLETGKFWSTDNSDDKAQLLSFDPEYNKFEKYETTMPANPFTNTKAQMRGYTDLPAKDGWFYGNTLNGAMFRFMPETDDGPVIEPLGVTWHEGDDVLQWCVSPGGKYVYYYPRKYPAPLIQYDVETGTKKVLGWFNDYFFDKYGYWLGATYGMEISKDGSFIVVNMNGAFKGRNENYGKPSIFIVEIPEEERQED